jgi:hypothetical protein
MQSGHTQVPTSPGPIRRSPAAWWNRRFAPEIDLVGADRAPVAGAVFFAGSVKWPARPFDQPDRPRARCRGDPRVGPETAALAVVSLSGTTSVVASDGAGLVRGPREVVSAWES